MVEYVTRDRLRYLSQVEVAAGFTRVARAEKRTPNGTTTFLSHSSEDNDLMPAVVAILENDGASVYLDNQDDRLKSKTAKKIASSLRSTIGISKRFVLFASPNVKNSRWVPWELGLADGQKGYQKVALFPSPDKANETYWSEQEYLGIYDRIVWGKIDDDRSSRWIVWNHVKNTAVGLKQWLAGY